MLMNYSLSVIIVIKQCRLALMCRSVANIIVESETPDLSSCNSTLSSNHLCCLVVTVKLFHRLFQNWSDATTDEGRWFPNFQTAETKAQRFSRLFIDKAIATSPELFDDYILSKAMPMYLQLHVTGLSFIDALPRGRFNKYVSDWMKSMSGENRKFYLDRLSSLLQKELSSTN